MKNSVAVLIRKNVILILVMSGSIFVNAQWSQPDTQGNIYYSGGPVGVGVATPGAPFHVRLSSSANTAVGLIVDRNSGSSSSSTPRGIGMVFQDGSNNTYIGGIAGVRTNPSATFNGDLAFFVNNTGGAS